MISVCLASYNGEKFIKPQIESILSQLNDNDELIISDDGSDDNTLKIIKGINDKRIKLLINKTHKGVNGNFENALNASKGESIFLADQDDIWLPNKVSICLKELEKFDLVVSNCKVIDEYENILHQSYFKIAKSEKGFIKNLYKSSYLGCCLAFRGEVLREILPFPRQLLQYHDWWIGFIAEISLNVNFIDTPCMLYRRHDYTVTNTIGKSKLSLFNKIYYRIQLLIFGLERKLKLTLGNDK